jgi:diaminopimelate decarboxylase
VKAFAADSGDGEILEGLTLLLEPGRSIIADAGICLTTVRNKKARPTSESSPPYEGGVAAASADGVVLPAIDTWLLTDVGFNNLLSTATYKWYYHLISAERAGDAHDTPYKLAGPLCDGGDVYFDVEGKNRLPTIASARIIEPNEILAFLNAGAYTVAQESQYNGRFLPAVVVVRQDGKTELIRRRECFEDLIASDV